MRIRKIVRIDQEKCNGCGLCVPNCAEGALKIVDGKAKLLSDVYCDGLGACLGHCPQGAITIIERKAEDFSETEVNKLLENKIPEAGMEKYLNRNIKELIKEFPRLERILEGYNIGCVDCSVGSCLLKDIIEIHNLKPQIEAELMLEIEKELYPGREIKKRPLQSKVVKPKTGINPVRELHSLTPLEKTPWLTGLKSVAFSNGVKYSPPIKKLADEHILIKDFIALIEPLAEFIKNAEQLDSGVILECVDFIRGYADKYHHMKEEDILFKKLDANPDIIKVMLEDHTTGRGYVKEIIEGISKKDRLRIIENLKAYKDLLTQHIQKEDEILYPWIDRGLSISGVGRLYAEFNEKDETVDRNFISHCQDFIAGLKKKLAKK